MAKKLSSFDFKTASRTLHDWATYFNGSIYQLEQGKDFTSTIASFVSIVRNRAGKRGLKVNIAVDKKENTVTIQASPKDGAKVAQPKPTKIVADKTVDSKPPKAEKPASPKRAPKGKGKTVVTESTPSGAAAS